MREVRACRNASAARARGRWLQSAWWRCCARVLKRRVQEVDKMKRGFEEQMTKMRGEVSKIQEEKVCGGCGGESVVCC